MVALAVAVFADGGGGGGCSWSRRGFVCFLLFLQVVEFDLAIFV